MTIGSITPASTLPAPLVPSETGASGSAGTGSLFSALLAKELEDVTEQLAGAAASDVQPPGAAATTSSRPADHCYVVSYVHGATPVTTGSTPAPLVKGTTGTLVLTARTTGLTQLTAHLTGTVGAPTAAAKATASVMAEIATLVAKGQA